VTTLLIDLALVGTVAFCTWRGYKGGLIRGAFGVVSLIASLFIANIAAQAYSNEAKNMLVPFVSGYIETTMTEMAETGVEYQEMAHDHVIVDENFGIAYITLRELGLPESAAVSVAEKSIEIEPEEDFSYFSDAIADRLTNTLSYVAVFGIAFLLIAIIFAVIGNLVGFVFALPGLKLVDIIAGSALGLVKGVIIVYTVAVIVRYFGLLMLSTIEGTVILKYLINNNPIANLLGV